MVQYIYAPDEIGVCCCHCILLLHEVHCSSPTHVKRRCTTSAQALTFTASAAATATPCLAEACMAFPAAAKPSIAEASQAQLEPCTGSCAIIDRDAWALAWQAHQIEQLMCTAGPCHLMQGRLESKAMVQQLLRASLYQLQLAGSRACSVPLSRP